MATDPVDVFVYTDYRLLIQEWVAAKSEKGLSYRYFAKKAGFASPNYLQQVISGRKNLSREAAGRVAGALGLSPLKTRYFVALVCLADGRRQEEALEELRRCVVQSQKRLVKDAAMYSHWLNGVIFELASLDGFAFDAANVYDRLKRVATMAEVETAIKFLVDKKWLVPAAEGQAWKQQEIEFEALNDVRRIDLMRSHMRFLEMAKHALVQPLDEREYQGLTMAIPLARLPDLKARIRKLMEDVRSDVDGATPRETVMRLQIALFKVTSDQAPKDET